MKIKLLFFSICVIICTSCATIFCGSRAKITLTDDKMKEPVNLTIDGQMFDNVYLPAKIKVKRGFQPTKITANADGYATSSVTVNKKFNPVSIINLCDILGWGIDAATGAMMKPEYKYYNLNMHRTDNPQNYIEDPTIVSGEARNMVSRDIPGQTALERTIIRWFFDSDPRGARIYWRVVSSIPAVVKNTNETYLMTTPFEETRAFNILGLTYENSRDVQIEIKVSKKGYEDQVKRFNVRQAIDQQEISGFFEMVSKTE